MHPVRKAINSWWFLVALLVVLGLFVINTFSTTKIVQTYLEVDHNLYKLSWKCIAEHYADELSEEGLIFSYDEKPKCEEEDMTLITDYVIIIENIDSPKNISEEAKALEFNMKDSGANASFMQSAKIRRSDNNEVVEDLTETVRAGQNQPNIDDFFPDIPEEKPPSIKPPERSVPEINPDEIFKSKKKIYTA